jgi:ubiquinone/menaquinone biosynthesis C-methylase UbiE
MKESQLYLDLIDKERNIYELSELFNQNRRPVLDYINILQDPHNGNKLSLFESHLKGYKEYEIYNNIPNFTSNELNSTEWKRLNNQFLNYHKSLSLYTLINSTPIINFLSLDSRLGFKKNCKVLDVGGGTGHTHASFFQYPDEIEYFLLDPNLRLLHDQFIRIYPKLSYLSMAHILGNAEKLPFKDNSFDLLLNISAIDHLEDYEKFIDEAFRVLNHGGELLISSHLDIPVSTNNKTKLSDKLLSSSLWERVARYNYYRKHQVGEDDHTLHLENTKPIEKSLIKSGFKIRKMKAFKRYFYFIAEK